MGFSTVTFLSFLGGLGLLGIAGGVERRWLGKEGRAGGGGVASGGGGGGGVATESVALAGVSGFDTTFVYVFLGPREASKASTADLGGRLVCATDSD